MADRKPRYYELKDFPGAGAVRDIAEEYPTAFPLYIDPSQYGEAAMELGREALKGELQYPSIPGAYPPTREAFPPEELEYDPEVSPVTLMPENMLVDPTPEGEPEYAPLPGDIPPGQVGRGPIPERPAPSDAFTGGQSLPMGGGEVTFPTGQGVNLEMLYVMDPDKFKESFPALVTEEGKFDHTAFQKVQAAKQGIGERPPEDRLRDIDYTDAAGFEREVIKRLPVNPMSFNPMQQMEQETTTNLPALFRHIFRGQVAWNDRDSLNEQQNKYWLAVKNSYRAQTLERHQEALKNAKWSYEQQMKRFHEAAGRQLTRQKAAKGAEVKAPTRSDWRAERGEMKQDYKFKTLKDLIDDKAANAVVGAAQKVYDRLRRAGRFTTPLETRMEAAKFVRDTINQYWDYVRDLDPDDEADKAKLDFYQKAVKEKVGYVPKREVIER